VIALARRPRVDLGKLFEQRRSAPVVLLENPSHLGNVGAVIRVAAAAGAAAVLTTGVQDPWHPAAVRGSAGLHFVQPVARISCVPEDAGPLLAIDPDGKSLDPAAMPADAILVFGSERQGLSAAMLGRADRRLAIPMAHQVSSLNLATAAAVVLYAWRMKPGIE
jgi:tRNA G18 (ribose-2'-O)-methylase SpoU